MANIALDIIPADLQKLWEKNPLAEEQVKGIILNRLLDSSDQDRALLRKRVDDLQLRVAAMPKGENISGTDEFTGPVPVPAVGHALGE